MREKVDSYLGFAKKSGQLVTGTQTCGINIDKGKLKLLIIAEDTAEGSKEKMIRQARQKGLEYRVYGKRDELSHLVGSEGSCIFGIKDGNFAEVIVREIDENEKDKEVF